MTLPEFRLESSCWCNSIQVLIKCSIFYFLLNSISFQDSTVETVILISPKFGVSQISSLRNTVVSNIVLSVHIRRWRDAESKKLAAFYFPRESKEYQRNNHRWLQLLQRASRLSFHLFSIEFKGLESYFVQNIYFISLLKWNCENVSTFIKIFSKF